LELMAKLYLSDFSGLRKDLDLADEQSPPSRLLLIAAVTIVPGVRLEGIVRRRPTLCANATSRLLRKSQRLAEIEQK
jgi:hypothetical protein